MKINRENKIDANYYLVLIIAILVLIFIWIAPQKESGHDSLENVITDNGSYSLFLLGKNDKVEQKFCIKGDKLDGIEILLAGFSDKSNAEVIVTIYDDSSVFEQKSLPLSQLKNGEFTKINFNNPISLKKERTYILEVRAEKLKKEENLRICYYYDSETNATENAWVIYNNQSIAGNVLAVKYDYEYSYVPYATRKLQCIMTGIVIAFIICAFLISRKRFSRLRHFFYAHENIFFLVITLIACGLYLFGPMRHTIPWTEGWGEAYADLIDAGKFPYRDFYYYMPPADLLFTWLLWKISFRSFFVYSCYRLIERLAILAIMYYIISKFSKPLVSAISTFVGCIILSATVYDLIGDYNQSALLYVEILCVLIIQYMEVYYASRTNSFKRLFLIGLCVGMSFLLKQPLFIAEALFTYGILTLFFIKNKIQSYLQSLFITVSGISIPILICSVVLFVNHAFYQFFNQVFLTNAKGNGIGSLLLVAFKVSLEWKFLVLIFVLISGIYILKKNFKNVSRKSAILIELIIIAIWIGIYYESYVNDFIKNVVFSKIGCVFLLCGVILCFLWLANTKINNCLRYVASFLVVVLPCMNLYFMPSEAEKLYGETDFFSLLRDLVYLSFWIGVSTCVFLFDKLQKENGGYIFSALGAGIMYCYMRAMGASDSIPTAGGALICAIVVALGLRYLQHNQIKIMLCIFCTIISLICMSQKVINAYSWWGWSESCITQDKNYTIDIPGLQGYKVDYDTKDMYERMYKVIKKNSDGNSTIYGFPYVKIFNVLLNNSNATWFVPVPFYDVCSDYYAEMDSIELAETPPDIVVWCDIPDCMETHESIFREGKSLGQRKIQKWFSEQVIEKKYILVGQYNNLFVYKKYNGEKVLYRDIQDKNMENQTIE